MKPFYDILVKFSNKNGDYYSVNQEGEIISTKWSLPSRSWKILGSVEFGRGYCGGSTIRTYSFQDILNNKVPWFFKNGKQRCFVKDLDHSSQAPRSSAHGTIRIWRSPSLTNVWLKGYGYVK